MDPGTEPLVVSHVSLTEHIVILIDTNLSLSYSLSSRAVCWHCCTAHDTQQVLRNNVHEER